MKPGSTSVMPVTAEMIGSGDGEKKQDCEPAAGKRWVTKYGEAYRWLKPTLLGDDLYSHEPFCRQVEEAGYSFIFTCKNTTHQPKLVLGTLLICAKLRQVYLWL
ncbi:MAG: hypothetical protein LBB98_11695 [Treponema sp.]|nr:hypothetical protein [Treponema sp.]